MSCAAWDILHHMCLDKTGALRTNWGMETFIDLIDAWPTLSAFADDIGVSYEAAKAWRRRNSVPAPYWGRLIECAAARGIPGVTADLLVGLAAAKPCAASA